MISSAQVFLKGVCKHAVVSPVPKVRPQEDLETDFRQVSVLPVLGKILERVQIMLNKDQTLTTRDCKGSQTNMPKNVGSIKSIKT